MGLITATSNSVGRRRRKELRDVRGVWRRRFIYAVDENDRLRDLARLELESKLLVDRVEDADAVRSGTREQTRRGPLDREIPFALETGLDSTALPLPFATLAAMRAKSSIDMLWQSTTCCGTVSGEGAVCGCPWQFGEAAASAAGFILGLPLPVESTNPGSSFESLWSLRLNRSRKQRLKHQSRLLRSAARGSPRRHVETIRVEPVWTALDLIVVDIHRQG